MSFAFPKPITMAPLEFIYTPVEVIKVKGTRIPIDTIIAAYHRGDTVAEIDSGFPTIGLSNIYAILSYYLDNQPMIDAYIERGEKFAEEMRAKWEALYPPDNLWERLNAHKADVEENAQVLSR